NRAPLDDFHGLSPEQMSGLLYAPFDAPHLVTFPEEIQGPVRGPSLTLLLHLADAAAAGGIKCTATGNLPPALCRAPAEAVPADGAIKRTATGNLPPALCRAEDEAFAADGYTREGDRFGIHKEQDFMELHVTRIVAKAAGLTRHYRGRVLLTSIGRKLLQGPG